MFASTVRSLSPSAAPAAARFSSEWIGTRGQGPDLASATRLGHRFQPIQRVLATDRLDALPESLHRRLAPRIKAFNRHLAAKPKSGEGRWHRDEQFRLLHEIEQHANAHLTENPEADEASRTALFSLLRDTEDHHVQTTRKAVDARDALWLPSSVGGQDRRHAQKLWKSIVGGKGNLKIQGDAGFRGETHSGIAKLLQGRHGRGLLQDLNARQPSADRQVEIRRGDSSGAQALDLTRNSQLAHGPNVGTGSIVRIQEREPEPASLDAYESGRHGEAIFSPRFISLGHELGHARHNLAGTTASLMWSDQDRVQDPVKQELWTDPEEYRNIKGEENALRAEHRLPTRKLHSTIGAARSTRHRLALHDRLGGLYDRVPPDVQGALSGHFSELGSDIDRTDLADDHQAQTLHARLDETERGLPSRVRWQQAKNFGRKALPYAAAGVGLGVAGAVAAKKYGWF